jgi:hypothetical protein
MKTEIVRVKIIQANSGSTCWFNNHVGETFLARQCETNEKDPEDETSEGWEMFRILDTEPIVAQLGIGGLYLTGELGEEYREYEVLDKIKEVKEVFTKEDLQRAHFNGKVGKESFTTWFEKFSKK